MAINYDTWNGTKTSIETLHKKLTGLKNKCNDEILKIGNKSGVQSSYSGDYWTDVNSELDKLIQLIEDLSSLSTNVDNMKKIDQNYQDGAR